MLYRSPAKLNLFFKVLHKRADGYHEIRSLYQAIDLFDTLSLEKASQDRLTCTDPELPTDERNLVWRALQLFRTKASFAPVHLHLEKRIPMQAGLGGGSSNAATTLWALNRFAGEPCSLLQLQELGAQLGSDVPFFFSRGTALCTGRGEKLEEQEPLELRGVLVKPPYGLSTPTVYRETRVGELQEIKAPYFNDLEGAALRLEPRLKALKEQLLGCGFQTVCMTGSGSAFFCLGDGLIPKGALAFRAIQREKTHWF